MSPLREDQGQARKLRAVRAAAESALDRELNQLAAARQELDRALRLGDAGREEAARLERRVAALDAAVRGRREALGAARADLDAGIREFPGLDRPQELIEELDDRTPFLLLPVRVETRFMGGAGSRELWIRVFPDDIAVHTHEAELTADELAAGHDYWRELWAARRLEDPEERERGAWLALAGEREGPRAAWIARRTEPASLDVPSPEELAFPELGEGDLKPASWTRAPRADVMPDRLVFLGTSDGATRFETVGSPIPDPLFLGPDPRAADDDLAGDGDLLAGEDLAWMHDFDRAVAVGMAVRVPLSELDATRGFDRILVLGLRLSADADEGAALVEGLLDAHHYSPDGISLLPQGTPTNNTGSESAGFSAVDPGAAGSFEIERGDPLIRFEAALEDRSDGQLLAEALGISLETFAHVRHADGRDLSEARAINGALWPATWGYFLEEMLGLSEGAVAETRAFFERYVSARGPLPAIRVGAQPYGVLVTSAAPRWRGSRELEGRDFAFLQALDRVVRRIDLEWRELAERVAHAGSAGEPFQNLLDMLGLHATSVERHRRQGVGVEYLWNYQRFTFSSAIAELFRRQLALRARAILEALGLELGDSPKLFDLAFFGAQDLISDPFVADVERIEDERWSESEGLARRYRVGDDERPHNYIGWLLRSGIDDVKRHRFTDAAGEPLDAPRALLYRMLHRAFLLAHHDAAVRLYVGQGAADRRLIHELELSNVRSERNVTPWEVMEAPAARVLPDLTRDAGSVVEFLRRPEGAERPEALGLRSVREALESLEGLPTARLERLFAEHLDLCAYRLDAWQTSLFAYRLDRQRPAADGDDVGGRRGVYLGAFGWLEDVRPGPAPVTVEPGEVPESLLEPDRGPITEQPDNGGFIHGPSLNHAVTAAILRNAYLTHAEPASAERMAVNLSSERVRIALSFLDGIRSGQELGALLGYQFERGLHESPGAVGAAQFLPAFRERYPLVADKITLDERGEPIESKEALNVFDGYAFLEAAFLRDPPVAYPYDVGGLPAPDSPAGRVIQGEVGRMAASLDAVADLALAEGVYQVAQGNYERASASVRVLTEGASPPEPEIVRTPRSGATVGHRICLHFESGVDALAWPADSPTPRATAAPGVNRWLGRILGPPERIRYIVRFGDPESADATPTLADLGLQPIDLVSMVGDEVAEPGGTGTRDDTTALEGQIAYSYRRARRDADGSVELGDLRVSFMERDAGWDPIEDKTLFEILPLLRALRELVTSCRPLGADDYRLASETTTDPATDPNPKGFDEPELDAQVTNLIADFSDEIDGLAAAIAAAELPGAGEASLEALREALVRFALRGLRSALPRDSVGTSAAAFERLLAQAREVRDQAAQRRDRAAALAGFSSEELSALSVEERVERRRAAARELLGASFSLLPRFRTENAGELAAAAAFRDTPAPGGLTRFSGNPLVADEWLQGVSRVRGKVRLLEEVCSLNEMFGRPGLELAPLQLPFRPRDHWIAVEYPEAAGPDDPDAFRPEGDFLSIVQHLAGGTFDPAEPQIGLVIDEWNEIIPSRVETTGVAIHYDQPSSQPPQALLLAVAPELTGSWSWEDLVATLHDTLDRARQRGVEPDQIKDTPFGHVLPAILTAVTSFPFATISTDLVFVTADSAPTEGPTG